jgi:amino acid adenylation domain-containing protein
MIVKRFEQQIKKNPHKLAIKTGRESITYEELNRYANRIAQRIREKCPNPTTKEKETVGLLFEEAIDMIAAIIGVLKSGKVYVPLSPGYPAGRLSYMISHSEISLILTDFNSNELAGKLASEPIITNACDWIEIEEIKNSVSNPGNNHKQEDGGLMYILYTSGSTGKPKGVMQNQNNVLKFIDSYTKNLTITGNDRMTLFSAFTHDAAVMDLYGALLNGATLYPMNILKLTDLTSLSRWLVKEGITVWHSVPTVYRYFVNTLKGEETYPHLRFIVLGGEAVIRYDIDMFHKRFPHTTLYNLYGQTESSYNSGMFIKQGDSVRQITLGEVVEGTKIFVVDHDGSDVDTFETGEIIIASPYVSPGYWKDQDATKKSFQEDPENGKLYRTGDFGCLLLDGCIEFTGRKDSQVKIRGHRIELGEIESLLLMHDHINDAVVTAVEKENVAESPELNGDRYIAAYVVSGRTVDSSQLREYLFSKLPDYMIPTYFVQLDSLPLTQSGKIDRKALPGPEYTPVPGYLPPRNKMEEKLVEIWEKVLGRDKIGINENFFMLGGDSIKSIQIAARMKKAGYWTDIRNILKNPTISTLAPQVKKLQETTDQAPVTETIPITRQDIRFTPGDFIHKGLSIESVDIIMQQYPDIEDLYTLTPMQEGMLFHALVEDSSYTYFRQKSYRLVGKMDMDLVEQSFNELFKRHEILRTAFVYKDIPYPVQVVLNNRVIDFFYHDISNKGKIEEKETFIKKFKEKDKRRSFDLSKDVLMRVAIFDLGGAEYEVTWSFHHILMDGWSSGILSAEFLEIYASLLENRKYQLPPVIPYRSYINWLEKRDKNVSKNYWKKYLDSYKEMIVVPGMKALKGNEAGYKKETVLLLLDKKETDQLEKIAGRNLVTINIAIQTLWGILLGKYNGIEDVVFGVVVSGRPSELEGVESMIGLLINTVPVRIRFEEKMKFQQLIQKVQEEAIESEQHHYYPLVEIQSESVLKRNLINHLYGFENYPVIEQIEGYESKTSRVKFKLSHLEFSANSNYNFNIVTHLEDQLSITLIYNSNVYHRSSVERIASHLRHLLHQVLLHDGDVCIKELSFLSEEEKDKLITGIRNRKNKSLSDYITVNREMTENISISADFDY